MLWLFNSHDYRVASARTSICNRTFHLGSASGCVSSTSYHRPGCLYECMKEYHKSACTWILCFVDRASRYIRVMKTNTMHYLSSVYFVSQPLHVSGIFVAHHQEVYCIYTTIGTCCAFQLTVCCPNPVNWTAQHVPVVVYEGESTENLKSAIEIRTTARLSCKFQQWYSWFEDWPTCGSTILHRKVKSLCTFCVQQITR